MNWTFTNNRQYIDFYLEYPGQKIDNFLNTTTVHEMSLE